MEANKKGYNREDFLLRVITQFYYKKDKDDIRRTYDGLIQLLEQDIASGALDQNIEKRKIIEGCYDIFRDDTIREMIYQGKFSTKKICEMSKEKILGDKKRSYDMSHLFSENILDIEDGRNVKYLETQGNVFHFLNARGEEVDIQLIGTLTYNSKITHEYVNKYRVTKREKGDNIESFEGFAEIVLAQMQEDDEYRDVALREIFGKNNVELSNAGGYFGGIGKMDSMKVGQELEDASGYYYKASPNYALYYSRDMATMVMSHAKQQEARKLNNSEGR